MIDTILNFLATEFGNHLKSTSSILSGQEEKVVLSGLVNLKGEPIITSGTISLSLINIEEEKSLRAPGPKIKSVNNNISYYNPEIKLNLYVLWAANFDNGRNSYKDACGAISSVISFFQGQQVFSNKSYPALGENVEKIIMELNTLSFEQQNQLWSYLGAKYVPSVVYKVRMISIQEDSISKMGSEIISINGNLATI